MKNNKVKCNGGSNARLRSSIDPQSSITGRKLRRLLKHKPHLLDEGKNKGSIYMEFPIDDPVEYSEEIDRQVPKTKKESIVGGVVGILLFLGVIIYFVSTILVIL
jgi:hypothetical protein